MLPTPSNDELIQMLNALADELNWSHPLQTEVVAEMIGGYPRYEQTYIPNQQALRRAAIVREAAERLRSYR